MFAAPARVGGSVYERDGRTYQARGKKKEVGFFLDFGRFTLRAHPMAKLNRIGGHGPEVPTACQALAREIQASVCADPCGLSLCWPKLLCLVTHADPCGLCSWSSN